MFDDLIPGGADPFADLTPGASILRAAQPTGGFVASAKQSAGSLIKGAGQLGADFIPGVGKDNALKQYGQEVIDALVVCWAVLDGPAGKILRPALPVLVAADLRLRRGEGHREVRSAGDLLGRGEAVEQR